MRTERRSELPEKASEAAKTGRLTGVKVRDLVRLIESDGWKHVRTTGSHRHFKHAAKPNVVTVPGNPGDDVPIGTLKAILRAAGWERAR